MEKMMSAREFLTAVINGVDLTDAHYAKAQAMLEALDRKNERARGSESKEKKETTAKRELVLSVLCDAPMTRDEIANACGLTTGEVGSACSSLVRDGLATKTERKVDKRKLVAYVIKSTESTEEGQD